MPGMQAFSNDLQTKVREKRKKNNILLKEDIYFKLDYQTDMVTAT